MMSDNNDLQQQQLMLASPDELDQLMVVAKGRLGFVFLGLLIGFLMLLFWGLFGKIPETIDGKGILVREGGIFNVVSEFRGRLRTLDVDVSGTVYKGQVIGTLYQPRLAAEIDAAKTRLAELKAYNTQLKRIKSVSRSDLLALTHQINQSVLALQVLQASYRRETQVVSPFSGQVIELLASEGDFFVQGSPIVSLELAQSKDKPLQAILYFSPRDGKKIRMGLPAYIAPASVYSEEVGYLLGEVSFVAEFPATREGMLSILNNKNLVNLLSSNEAPLKVGGTLVLNPETPSGYQWTTPKGSVAELQSGTLCDVHIVIREDPPLFLVFPKLADWLKELK